MPATGAVFIATSLDGFIARPNGDIDWLTVHEFSPEEDYGYREFVGTVDVLVMGRHSYEKVLTFGEWPYTVPVIVLTTRELVPRENVRVLAATPQELMDRLESEGIRRAYIDGGETIQRFLRAGLISEMTITTLPILIGEGIPLFGRLEKDVHLTHLETRAFTNGFVQSRYRLE